MKIIILSLILLTPILVRCGYETQTGMNERKLVQIKFKHPGSDLHCTSSWTPLSTLTLRLSRTTLTDNTSCRFHSVSPDLPGRCKADTQQSRKSLYSASIYVSAAWVQILRKWNRVGGLRLRPPRYLTKICLMFYLSTIIKI